MSVVWQIEYRGERRPLSAWGIRGATFTRRSFAADELALDAPGLAIDAAPLFAAQSEIILWRDAARWFTGRITSPEAYGSAREEGHRYVASGPWWLLENIRYQEARMMAADPTDADSPLVEVFSPRAVLFNTLEGGQQTAAQQIQAALAYANTLGARVALGAISLAVQPPWEEASSISCAEVVKRCARYAPDAVQWWDYSTARPTFRLGRRAELPAVALDLDAADRVELIDPIRPLYEARPPGVRFFYEDIVAHGDGSTRSRYTQQSAGNPDAIGAINEVIELGGQGGQNPEPIPEDLAANYYAAVSTLNYGGRLRLRGRDVAGDITPGKALNLTHGRAEWATMRATVQSWSADLVRGLEEVQIGQASFLGAAEFVEYLRYSRLRTKTNYLDARRTGEGVTSAASPRANLIFHANNTGYTEIELCSPTPGGVARKIKVFSEILQAGS